TNTYKRRGNGKPRIVTYVDGPFYPDGELPLKERRRELRDRVYDCMKQRSLESDVVWIEYRPADEDSPAF
ncbi:MAG: acyl-phosphate glycerol 3-phosphate acyltransferase, partial [Clostridia bacterium]|nr:acyl-phosphate glycerol 3-phosphate acyltransferase [Clostridia bacterium]